MRTKFLISLLNLSILISTMGLSLTYHFCELMGVTISDNCKICENIEHNDSNCCEEESDVPNNLYITSYDPTCCHTEIVEIRVEDQFLVNKFELENLQKFFHQVVLDRISNDSFTATTKQYQIGLSPPLLNQTDLNILHSTFLI